VGCWNRSVNRGSGLGEAVKLASHNESRIPNHESRLAEIPAPQPLVRPVNRGVELPMCGSLILPIEAMRSSAMRSAAL